jgi:hypothetical protein
MEMKTRAPVKNILAILAAAAGLALFCGSASAQVVTPNPNTPLINPQTPILGFNQMGNPISSGFANGGFAFQPGFAANPFFTPFGWSSWGSVTAVPPFRGVLGLAGIPAMPGQLAPGAVPLLGINVMPPYQPVGRRHRTTTHVARATGADETRIAQRLTKIMAREPMVSGTVVQVGARVVRFRPLTDGVTALRRYALSDVFFYRGDDVLDAANSVGMLKPGDQVLVPERPDLVM